MYLVLISKVGSPGLRWNDGRGGGEGSEMGMAVGTRVGKGTESRRRPMPRYWESKGDGKRLRQGDKGTRKLGKGSRECKKEQGYITKYMLR